MTPGAIQKLLRPLQNRVLNMVARAVLNLADDAKGIQVVQVSVPETRTGERFQQYGFTSVPLDGAEAVVLFVGGSRDHPLVVAVDDRRHRLNGLQPGEVAIYTDEGDQVVIKRGGTIEAVASTEIKATAPLVRVIASGKVRMETPLLEVTGEIKDRCDLPTGRSMADMRSTYDSHTHGGVQSGASNSAVPNQQMD